jgi:hypothetical protein
MNLVTILRQRIEGLPTGDYSLGLKAVLQHVEVGIKHHERGQLSLDETAFTDAIYRTNQAFEGSLKEAYRVLAGKDPNKVSPFDIEEYLQKNAVLRHRVLDQLTNYRQDWRNPSAHDYRLDFDEDEALLAIVTVCAFAIVLTDQIAEKIAYKQAQQSVDTTKIPVTPISTPLLKRVTRLIAHFAAEFQQTHDGNLRDVEVLGALSGFLSTTAEDISVLIEPQLDPNSSLRPDLIITSSTEKIILELKQLRRIAKRSKDLATRQVVNYMALSGIKQAIVLIILTPSIGKVSWRKETLPGIEGEIVHIIAE